MVIQTSLSRPQYSDKIEENILKAKNFRQEGNHGKAINIYEEIIANDTKNAVVLVALGVTFTERGELEKARNTYKEGLKLCPEYSEQFLERLAQVERKLGIPSWIETAEKYDEFFIKKATPVMKSAANKK